MVKMLGRRGTRAVVLFVLLFAAVGSAMAYNVPQDSSKVKYFYVFGPEGNTDLGAEPKSELILYFDVNKNDPNDLLVAVYDPNIGGKHDFRVDSSNLWDTETSFSLYGNNLLKEETFGEADYESRYYQFGPFKKEQGKAMGDYYRFRLEVKGVKGDDANLFMVKVSPESAQTFTHSMTFRLLPHEGDEMLFYPEIPAGVKEIVVYNYDIDQTGGTSSLYDLAANKAYSINDSESGEWSQTNVKLENFDRRRLTYKITKGTQKYGNAGIRIADAKGNPVPIYFRRGKPMIVATRQETTPQCDIFTFDATSSYDPDNQELSYLWDFGDGKTSTDPVVTHAYEKGGEYTVTLTVKDNSGMECDTGHMTQVVKANTPPMAQFSAPEAACLGREVRFDASASSDDSSRKLTYMWEFGDGSKAEGPAVSKVFDKAGTYSVRLMVDDNEGTKCSMDSIRKSVYINTLPIAKAGDDITLCLRPDQPYAVNFDASGSSDADKDTLTYMWNFGDGSTGSGQKIAHTYARGGEYDVTLTLDDGRGSLCGLASDNIKVSLNKAPFADAGSDVKGCVGESVAFDGSGSYGEGREGMQYSWDLGDGNTATGVRVSHEYARGGLYKVMLTVDDGKGTTCSKATDMVTAAINTTPKALLAKVDKVCAGAEVAFDASASSDPDGDPLMYLWDFGDGTVREGKAKEKHTYSKGGTYMVALTLADNKGNPCLPETVTQAVRVNTPPVADAGASLVCCVGTNNMLDGSLSNDADGDTLSYLWDFGDGTTGMGQKTTHAYAKPGKYRISLLVDDNSGALCSKASDTFEAVVNEKPAAVIKVR